MKDQRSKRKEQNKSQDQSSKPFSLLHLDLWALILFCTLIFVLGISCSALAQAFAPGQVVVNFKPDIVTLEDRLSATAINEAKIKAASVMALAQENNVVQIKQLFAKTLEIRPEWKQLENYYVLYFSKTNDVQAVAQAFSQDSNVLSAQPDLTLTAFDTTPNDTYFSSQYGLTNIKAPAAWDKNTGSSSLKVAVLDTGINLTHEDFAGRIDTANAWDFVNNDAEPSDDNGHGTSVSGVIGAVTNNSKGVAGLDWKAQILPIKVLNSGGQGDTSTIADGITYAAAKNAAVLNMSFGLTTDVAVLRTACLTAYNNNAVLVAAAGNSNTETPSYPAAYSTVMAVAAVDQSDKHSMWSGGEGSNYGDWIDVCAPGTAIWSTNWTSNNSYSGSNNGTSLAAPFVSALASLVKASDTSLTNEAIRTIIKESTDNINALQEAAYVGKLGTGRINASKALAGVTASISSPASGAYVKGLFNILGTASGWNFSSYEVQALKSSSVEATVINSTTSVESGLLGSWDSTAFNGTYTLKLKVFSAFSDTAEATVEVIVDNTTPVSQITFPAVGATVSGQITVLGTAEDTYFDYYLLQYGEGLSPTAYQTIKQSYVSVEANALGTWETTGLNGNYTLKLTSYDKAGGSSSATCPVVLSNAISPTKEVEPQGSLPLAYALPNPFNRATTSTVTFNYSLQGNFNAKLYLFDLTGSLIWQSNYLAGENGGKAGQNNPSWNGIDAFGASVPAGVYLFQVIADNRVLARGKLIVLN